MNVVRISCWFGVWSIAFGVAAWADRAVGEVRGRIAQTSRAPILQPSPLSSANFLLDPITEAEAWRAVPTLRLEPIDLMALAVEDAVRDVQPGVPMRTGVNQPIPAAPLTAATDGAWTRRADGTSVWSLKVESPGAVALRVHFSRFDLPQHTRLVLRGNADEETQVYFGMGPLRKGSFWAPMTLGDVVFIEYQDRDGAVRAPRIEIDELSHIYRDPEFVHVNPADGMGGVADTSLGCHLDVNCMGAEAVARDSVGRMAFTVPGQGSFVCSGALVEDHDPNSHAGYFLTANHCLSTQEAANTLTVYWFYQSEWCGGTIPSLASLPRTLGAVLLATSSQSDFTFLRLLDDPHDGQGIAPLSTQMPPVGATVACIHHPAGSHKRYADGPVTVNPPICSELPQSRFLYNDWTPSRGVTEPGSSGAPLFNNQWEIVGQLFGACAFAQPNCLNSNQYNAVSGRMSFTYPLIEPFLNIITPDDEYEPNDSLDEAAEIEPGTYELRLVDLEDYFQFTIGEAHEVVVTITFDPQDMDAELRLLSADGSEIDAVASFAGAAMVSVPVVAGEYVVRVSKTGGWGGDYTLDIELLETLCSWPAAVSGEVPATSKNRYISFEPGDNPGMMAAIKVSFATLNRTSGDQPGMPDFSAAEGASMWVGPPEWHDEPSAPKTEFPAARLQCEPYYTDWSGMGLIQVYGPEIVPASTYEIGMISEHCAESNPQNYSESLVVTTNRWGDVVAPLWPEFGGQPNFADVSALVDRFRDVPDTVSRLSAQLQPQVLNPSANVNFADVSAGVDAFRGLFYPFSGPQTCP